MNLEGISRFCFGASYAVALALELLQLLIPARWPRRLGWCFGIAGFCAHSLYLVFHPPALQSPYGSLLLLAWVLAVFCLYGMIHYPRLAWAVFVLPLVLGLILLAGPFSPHDPTPPPSWAESVASISGTRFWGNLHGILILLASVGISVGALASAMYLFQARQLRVKTAPSQGLRLLSLERLERMIRRSINLAFPLLTVGLVVGAVLMTQHRGQSINWIAGKIWGTVGLWIVFAVLLLLRYGRKVRGRQFALGTIAAFVILLVTLAASHPIGGAAP